MNATEKEFLKSISHHFEGWQRKITHDFSKESYDKELADLSKDPVYSKFALNCPEYVLVRFMGRMSISIGRRLGEMYDKLPRFIASARFGLSLEQIAEKFHGLELDVGLRYSALSNHDKEHIVKLLSNYGADSTEAGVGIEIRYNFNPNDSARLRKDEAMAKYVLSAKLFPLYLIYSDISPRDDAIGRLTRAGWKFLRGNEALDFTNNLFGVNFMDILQQPQVRNQIQNDVQKIMTSITTSYAFSKILNT